TCASGRFVQDDFGPREDSSLDPLSAMRPSFDRRSGTVTIGNSCPITDGAAAVLLMSRRFVHSNGIESLRWLRGWAYAGLEPERMGLGPAYATARALAATGTKLRD